MDTSNSVMPAHKVKPGYHHRLLANGDTGVSVFCEAAVVKGVRGGGWEPRM